MQRIKYQLFFILLLTSTTLYAQTHKAINYGLEEGILSLNVYKLHEDSKGNLWIGTVNGVSKYDGYGFNNYTTRNGLAENFVIYFCEDYLNRIWYLTYNGYIGYFENEKPQVFPFNKTIQEYRENNVPTSINVTKDQSIYIGYRDADALYINRKSGFKTLESKENVYTYTFDNGFVYGMNSPPREINNEILIVDNYNNSHTITLQNISDISFISVGRMNDILILSLKFDVIILKNNKIHSIHKNLFNDFITNVYVDNYNQIWFSTKFNGVFLFEKFEDIGQKKAKQMYSDKTCSGVIQDMEGGYWFAFIREGLFYIPSLVINNITLESGIEDESINSMCYYKESILFSTYKGKLYRKTGDYIEEIHLAGTDKNFQRFSYLFVDKYERLWTIAIINNIYTLYVYDDFRLIYQQNFKGPVGQLRYDYLEETILICSNFSIFEVDSTFTTKEILQSKKTLSSINKQAKGSWIGTTSGLYYKNKKGIKKLPTAVNDIIVSIEKSENAMWFAAQNKGIGILTKDTIIYIRAKEDLMTNSVNFLECMGGNNVWVATSSGFRNIQFNPHTNTYELFNINSKKGLAGNDISCFLLEDSMVYIGTNKGLSYFDQRFIQLKEKTPKVYIKSLIVNNNKPEDIKKDILLKHNENYLRIHFSAISLRNTNDIIYKYQLKGLNSEWFYTKNTDVQYTNLKPGEYEFIVYATASNGKWSEKESFRFIIKKAFWQQPLFHISSALLIIFIIWLILHLRFSYIRKTNKLEQELYLTEKKALASQMNPHFIFNALNSIQRFLLQNDNKNADIYLSKFAHLIRLILNSSRENNINIEDEIKLLKIYLDIEKRRLDDKFTYEFIIDSKIQRENTYISPMIIQPLIENSIWHGIAPLDKQGHIRIEFLLIDNYIIVYIEDNGVGFRKMRNHIKNQNHKSVGISIIEERIEIMKKLYNKKDININIENLVNMYGETEGVLVIITLAIIENVKIIKNEI